MTPPIEVNCRVDYRVIRTGLVQEHTSRVDCISVTGCTIRTGQAPDGEALEMHIYLPDGKSPLRIDHAKLSWGHWDAFTVDFLTMPAKEKQRLQDYLSTMPVGNRSKSLWSDSESLAGDESEVWYD